MEDSSVTTPIIDVVDGAADSASPTESAPTTTVVGSNDAELLEILRQMDTQQQNTGQMMVICCGMIIGILLCLMARWWR